MAWTLPCSWMRSALSVFRFGLDFAVQLDAQRVERLQILDVYGQQLGAR
jgi:hypothetical protein